MMHRNAEEISEVLIILGRAGSAEIDSATGSLGSARRASKHFYFPWERRGSSPHACDSAAYPSLPVIGTRRLAWSSPDSEAFALTSRADAWDCSFVSAISAPLA